MRPPPDTAQDLDAITLAERILGLLDQGKFTATYKYAVLLALVDLCLEHTSKTGMPPEVLTTRQLAEKIIELYWPHTVPYTSPSTTGLLLQNAGARHAQAEIISHINRFRQRGGNAGVSVLSQCRFRDPEGYERLARRVEWKLIEMPLPRVQQVGNQQDRFIYEIAWDEQITSPTVTAYQQGGESDFDNRIHFKPGIAHCLVRLNGLLRPLIQKQWTAKVAQVNQLPETQLEEFLFGVNRAATALLKPPLRELQQNRCFYCHGIIHAEPEVDHFIPWARYPNDGLANLVLAHDKCNRHKSAFLAAADHVQHWLRRLQDTSALDYLVAVERAQHWPLRQQESVGVAAGIYLNLGESVKLWQEKNVFVGVDRGLLSEGFEMGAVSN